MNLAVYGNGLAVVNDVMNNVECVIKRVLKISVVLYIPQG